MSWVFSMFFNLNLHLLFMHVFIYTCVRTCACHDSHMEVRRQGSQFFSSTSWVLGVELSASYLVVMPLLTEPSLWPLIFYCILCTWWWGACVYVCGAHTGAHVWAWTCMYVFIPWTCMYVSVCAQRPQLWVVSPALLPCLRQGFLSSTVCTRLAVPKISRKFLLLLPISILLHEFSAWCCWEHTWITFTYISHCIF